MSMRVIRLIASLCLSLAVAINLSDAKTADEWKSRVIYQVLTDRFAQDTDHSSTCSDLSNYCGGTFNGIIRKLDYIQGLGVNAIWISPVPDNTDKGYHGYWQKNINLINSHFGSPGDLNRLISECHKRDIWVMLDVVGNHMGNQNYGDWNNFAKFSPFNHSEHYHPYCLIKDFDDQHQVEVCRLANLPDLDQSNSFVRTTLKNWVKNTISTYGFDGIRIDTTPEVPKDFWSEYTQAAGVFSIGEVDNGNPVYNAGYQGVEDATLNYPMYWKLRTAFQENGSMRNIHDGVMQNSAVFKDVSVLGNFLDNHDNPRFLSKNSDHTTLKNALAYIIFAEGIPIIYYGTEQGFTGDNDPRNREALWPNYNNKSDLYQFIGLLTNFRYKQGSTLWESKQMERYVDDNFFAFTRGKVFVATTNSRSSVSVTITYHPYSDGTVLYNVLDSSDSVTVSGGNFTVNMNGPPKVYSPDHVKFADIQEDIVLKQLENGRATISSEPLDAEEKSGKIPLEEGIGGIITATSIGAMLLIGTIVVVLAFIFRRRRTRFYVHLEN